MKRYLSVPCFLFLSFFIIISESSADTTNNCAATLSDDLALHIPILIVNNQSIWADFAYIPNTLDLTVTNFGYVSDTSPFGSCSPSTLQPDLSIRIPAVLFSGSFYWADFRYAGHDLVWTLTGADQSANIAGLWNIYLTDNGGPEEGPFTLTFTQITPNVFLAPGSDGDLTATVTGLNITILNTDSNNVTTTYVGRISDDWSTMSGTESTNDGNHSGTWRMIRTDKTAEGAQP